MHRRLPIGAQFAGIKDIIAGNDGMADSAACYWKPVRTEPHNDPRIRRLKKVGFVKTF